MTAADLARAYNRERELAAMWVTEHPAAADMTPEGKRLKALAALPPLPVAEGPEDSPISKLERAAEEYERSTGQVVDFSTRPAPEAGE